MNKPIILTIEIKNTENVGEITEDKLQKFAEIFEVLITKGALTGIKGGSAIIDFDDSGRFMQVRLNYAPWRRGRYVGS